MNISSNHVFFASHRGKIMVSAATIYLKRFQGVLENPSFSHFHPRNSRENGFKVAE
jgi:hypothetical protein